MLIDIFFTAPVTAPAQTPQIPEFRNEPMLITKDDSLKKLEQVHYESLDQVGPPDGGVSAIDYVTFDTPKSPVRADVDNQFIVKLTDSEVEPESVFFLTRVEHSRHQRFVYTNISSLYETEKLRIKLEFKKIAPGIYVIKPAELKAKSEYAFVYTYYSGNKARCFLFGTN